MSELTFEEFSPDERAAWLERSAAEYIAARMEAGDTYAEAKANADLSFERTFPGGEPGPSQMTGYVSLDGEPVGWLWIGPQGNDPERWWVWNVEIYEGRRGQGLGRRTMLLAEELAVANGARNIGLNVFKHNEVAHGLYLSLGYEETAVQMRKPLSR